MACFVMTLTGWHFVMWVDLDARREAAVMAAAVLACLKTVDSRHQFGASKKLNLNEFVEVETSVL